MCVCVCVCVLVHVCVCVCVCVWVYVYNLIFNLILLRKENKKLTLHSPLLLLLLLLASSACVREERKFSSRTMKVCGQHLQRLQTVCFKSMCAYMCCGGHIDPSVCLSLLMYLCCISFVQRCRVLLRRCRVLLRIQGSLYRALLREVRCFSKMNTQRDLEHVTKGLSEQCLATCVQV